MLNMINNTSELIVGIVVLNYKNFNETIECVNSLLLQREVLLTIVVVENGSENESYI